MGFNLVNAVKYIWRCDLKQDAIEDLKKARWYIDREIAKRENNAKDASMAEERGEVTYGRLERQGPSIGTSSGTQSQTTGFCLGSGQISSSGGTTQILLRPNGGNARGHGEER